MFWITVASWQKIKTKFKPSKYKNYFMSVFSNHKFKISVQGLLIVIFWMTVILNSAVLWRAGKDEHTAQYRQKRQEGYLKCANHPIPTKWGLHSVMNIHRLPLNKLLSYKK